jgi:choline dehydrogenase-like flavoprotein
VLILEAGTKIPPNLNGYMDRFYNAVAKVPESPYPPEIVDPSGNLPDPAHTRAGRPNSLMLQPDSWNDPKQSYLVQKGPHPFGSTYERVGGGTMLHWLGTSLRLTPNDFRMQSAYGQSGNLPAGVVDWPIGYSDLEGFYGDAERELGVSAKASEQNYCGIAFPDGYSYPMPEIPQSIVDKTIAQTVGALTPDDGEKFKFLETGNLKDALTVVGTPAARNSEPYQSRRVCAGNTNCIPICPIQAKYDPTVTLNDATNTANVKICYQTVASEIVVDSSGLVTAIKFKSYHTGSASAVVEGKVSAAIYIVAANAIETPRLLMMSTGDGRIPDGVANSSGMVGKNLMDHPYYVAWAQAPAPVFPYRGPLSTAGIEKMRDGAFRKDRAAFRIEIGNEGWNFVVGGVGGDPNVTTVDFVNGQNVSGLNEGPTPKALLGANLAQALNDKFTRQFRLGVLVEQTPDPRNCVKLSSAVDGLNLQRPEIHYDLSDYTKRGLAVAKQTVDALFQAMGATQFTRIPDNDPFAFDWKIDGAPVRLTFQGAGHIMGTYRMGSDPKQSVVDHLQRSHDHRNLYLVGSGVFPTTGAANPTLTIAALCLRTASSILGKNFG